MISEEGISAKMHAVIWDIAQGNPGAVNVVAALIKDYQQKALDTNDPATHGKAAAYTLSKLKTQGITGSYLWLAYKDVCQQNIKRLAKEIENDTLAGKLEALPYGGYHQ